MKRQRKFISTVVAISLIASITNIPLLAKAEQNYSAVESSVKQAVSEKSFYYYNMAYARVMELPAGYERDRLLSELSSLFNEVWTKDIAEIVESFEKIAKDKSGRVYDSLETKINNSAIKNLDKQYLLGELTGWGRNAVWSDDYKKAVSAVLNLWKDKTEAAALEAEKAISEVKVQINKEYITELLEQAKTALNLGAVILDSKYFSDSANNSVYVGYGNNVNIDLSSETAKRTIILKGNFNNLNINAPLATVNFEDAVVEKLTVLDTASSSIYLNGNTIIKNLIINDKDNNAHIVARGKSAVTNTEVRSGAKIDVNTDSTAANPFGNLQINTDSKKVIELNGDFKTTSILVNKPIDLKIGGIVNKLIVALEAKGSGITLVSGGKIQDIDSKTPIIVVGTGTVGKTAGEITDNTTKTTPSTGGGGSHSTDSAKLVSSTANFDKKTSAQADVVVDVILRDASRVTDVKANGVSIGSTNYSFASNKLTIKKEYLATKVNGALALTVEFNKGKSSILTVVIVDTTVVVGDVQITNIAVNVSADAKVTVEGNISSGAGKNVSVMLLTPDGKVDNIGQVISESEGKFTCILPMGSKVAGTYTVRIGGEGISTPYVKTFNFSTEADTVKPVITLVGEASVTVENGASYTDAGVTVTDNKDTDITSKLVTKIKNLAGNEVSVIDTKVAGTYTITYNVTDAAGNAAVEVVRTVIVKDSVATPDTVKPVITLKGDASVTVVNGASYVDAGATAVDNKDGDVTSKIATTITNSSGSSITAIDTTVEGTYTVTYSVTDAAGNKAEATRTVRVLPASTGEISNVVINVASAGRVTVEGNIASGSNKYVTIKMLDPTGTIDYLGQVTSTENGRFTFNYTINNLTTGNYTVNIGGEGVNSPYAQVVAVQ